MSGWGVTTKHRLKVPGRVSLPWAKWKGHEEAMVSISNSKTHTANLRPATAQRLRVLGGLHIRISWAGPGTPAWASTELVSGVCLELWFYLLWYFFVVVIFVFQSGTLKEPDSSKTPPQRPPPQGCLQYILDCNGIAVGPKQVQAS
jgi:hypothetical protein